MAAGIPLSGNLEAALDLEFDKIRAQVPVKATDLRSLWLDIVDYYRGLFAAIPVIPITKDEIEQGLKLFKSPEADPMIVQLQQEFNAIVKQYEDSGRLVDTALTVNICHLYSGAIIGGGEIRDPKKLCRLKLRQTAQVFRDNWLHEIAQIKRYLTDTGLGRALLVDASVLEPDFQGALQYLDSLLRFAISITDFAQAFNE